MSVATEFAPTVSIPQRARECPPPDRLATVTVLHRPSERTRCAPVRLTRRGVVALAVVVAGLAAVLVLAAWLSAPSGAVGAASATAGRGVPASGFGAAGVSETSGISETSSSAGAAGVAAVAVLAVRPGDSLWSIAARVAPRSDPRAEVAALQRLNGLSTASLVPGQLLRIR